MARSAALLLLSAAAIALAACSSNSAKVSEADPNVFPADYKKEIFATLVKLMDDPTVVHDAGITEPVLRSAGTEQRYTVCVRSNSRNNAHHYEGIKERVAYFYGGHLNQLIEAKDGQCAKVVYQPWPELEKYCLAKNCS